MKVTIPASGLRNHEKMRNLSDGDYVRLHVLRFEKVRPRHEINEQFLTSVLRTACDGLAPLAIIEGRTKSLPSFAEKLLRKRALYMHPRDPLPPDPLLRMTDLCGTRVIAQTSEQVHSICRFILETFDIDEDRSEDVSNRLKPTEFGYRSVHYIVSVNKEKLRSAGIEIPVPRAVLGLRAEIQVRTLLEHAWADLGHDLTYKTEVKVPDRIHRQFAAVAAVLESTDHEFGRLVRTLAEFKTNFGAHLPKEKVEKEIDTLTVLLSTKAAGADIAVRLAGLALAIGKHKLALATLQPYASDNHQGVQRLRGIALTEMHWNRRHGRGYLAGRRSLEAACAHMPKDAETLSALAESWADDDEAKARRLLHEAIVLDPTEPVTLSRYLEFEVARGSSDRVLRLTEPMTSNAMSRCRKQIEGGVNLPLAWSSLATFHLFRREPFEALDAVAHLINLCDVPRDSAPRQRRESRVAHSPCAAGLALFRMRETLSRIRRIRHSLPGYDWCERAVLVGLAARARDRGAMRALRRAASPPRVRPNIRSDEPVVILSGGCIDGLRKYMTAFKPHLMKAAEGLSFNLIWGGTEAGISGLASSIASRSRGCIHAYAYLPRRLVYRVAGNRRSMRFIRCYHPPELGFTPLEPLQGWTDLIAAGVDPRRVKLLSYAGGRISRFEYAMALALGARVGVIQDRALPEERQFSDSGWRNHGNLLQLPMDAMTLRAFLLIDQLPYEEAEFENAARKTHEEYVMSAIPREPSLLPWEYLPEDLRISNFHQIAYAANILKTEGLGFRPIIDPKKPLLRMGQVIGKEGIRRLAEMEHGRWNIERLLLGWHHSEDKDVARKKSPYLAPWDELPRNIREYDLKTIRSLPIKFHEMGLEIYEL